MANHIVPTEREIALTDNDLLVSKTDDQGYITYCNRNFMRIAGYPEKTLLKTRHNIIRHPDMPRGVYRHMWQTLVQGREYFGYLKNMSSDGSFYWLFTHIVPDCNPDGKLQSYFSVQRKPRPDTVARIDPIYREMLAIEKQHGTNQGPELSLAHMLERLMEFSTNDEHFVLHI